MKKIAFLTVLMVLSFSSVPNMVDSIGTGSRIIFENDCGWIQDTAEFPSGSGNNVPVVRALCESRLQDNTVLDTLVQEIIASFNIQWFGSIQAFAVSNVSQLPPGWLPCDNSRYRKADYPDLYDALDSMFTLGGDNTVTHFRTPNLAGQILRGSGGVNPDTVALGDFQTAQVLPQTPFTVSAVTVSSTGAHTHSYSDYYGVLDDNAADADPDSFEATDPFTVVVGDNDNGLVGNAASAFSSNHFTLSAGSHSHTVTFNATVPAGRSTAPDSVQMIFAIHVGPNDLQGQSPN